MATDTKNITDSATSGKTVIDDAVISKLIGIAVREVPGVHDLGGNASRVIGGIRSAVNQKNLSQGVSVEVGERQVAADIVIVAEYPTQLHVVSEKVRSAAIAAVTELVGMEITEVNVRVDDIYIPGDEEDEEEKRVN
jgi:uncharacterized alkaline shock family protein YloU